MNPIDWKEICLQLQQLGFGPRKLSRELNFPYSTVKNWRTGTEPTFSNGMALLAFVIKSTERAK